MFTAPQFLSRVRHRKECFILPAKLQCEQSRQKRFLVFACVLSRQGPGSVLTTSSATVQCGAHGNSAFKEWRKASGMERKRHEMSGNRVKNLFLPLCLQSAKKVEENRCRNGLSESKRRMKSLWGSSRTFAV